LWITFAFYQLADLALLQTKLYKWLCLNILILNILFRLVCLKLYICSMKVNILRERLLDTAGRLFYEQGYQQTGINQIIAEAGIAKGSFYYHFNSKSGLLVAYLDRFVNNWILGADIFLAEIADPKARVAGLISYRIANQKKNGFNGCALVKANAGLEAVDGELRKYIGELKQQMRDYVAAVISHSGHKKIISDEALTDMVVLLGDGALVGTAIYHNTDDLEKAVALITALI